MKKTVLILLLAFAVCAGTFAQTAQDYLKSGNAHYEKKDYDKAIADYTEAIKLNPRLAEAYADRGDAYFVKDPNKALMDFEAALKIDPHNAKAKSGKENVVLKIELLKKLTAEALELTLQSGDKLYAMEAYDEAIAIYEMALEDDPNNTRAKAGIENAKKAKTKAATAENFFKSGNEHFQKKDYDKAIADYTEAIKLKPRLAEAYFNRGVAYLQKKDFDRAIADFTEAIKLNPRADGAYSNRGDAYFQKKDYDKAIADFEAALNINPNNADAKKALEIVKLAWVLQRAKE
jgi:tetratricopeptide (TPR) repeat protein